MWVAWLNLEAAYGAPNGGEAAMALFARALQARRGRRWRGGAGARARRARGRGARPARARAPPMRHAPCRPRTAPPPPPRPPQYTDQKALYLALLGVLGRAGRPDLEEGALRAMTKKFGGSCKARGGGGAVAGGGRRARARCCQAPQTGASLTTRPRPAPPRPAPAQVWLRAIEHALTSGGPDPGGAARKLLERALAALPRRKHVKCVAAAALLEFRVGSPERGRSVMEGVLRNYPRRLDLWGVYVDQARAGAGGGASQEGRGARARGRGAATARAARALCAPFVVAGAPAHPRPLALPPPRPPPPPPAHRRRRSSSATPPACARCWSARRASRCRRAR